MVVAVRAQSFTQFQMLFALTSAPLQLDHVLEVDDAFLILSANPISTGTIPRETRWTSDS